MVETFPVMSSTPDTHFFSDCEQMPQYNAF